MQQLLIENDSIPPNIKEAANKIILEYETMENDTLDDDGSESLSKSKVLRDML